VRYDQGSPLAKVLERREKFLAIAGILFLILAFLCFFSIMVQFLYFAWEMKISITKIMDVSPQLILLVTGFLSLRIARALLTSGEGFFSSIPPNDFKLIADAIKHGADEPITQYIRVRSLSGLTGAFTKIGLTGLPLVTIGVTMIFTFTSLVFYQEEKIFTSLFDLAKLTLGAFIGSYVQRQVEQRRQAAEASAEGRSAPRPELIG
jgi:hypothetical protein